MPKQTIRFFSNTPESFEQAKKLWRYGKTSVPQGLKGSSYLSMKRLLAQTNKREPLVKVTKFPTHTLYEAIKPLPRLTLYSRPKKR